VVHSVVVDLTRPISFWRLWTLSRVDWTPHGCELGRRAPRPIVASTVHGGA
jgi:hypothetical protein